MISVPLQHPDNQISALHQGVLRVVAACRAAATRPGGRPGDQPPRNPHMLHDIGLTDDRPAEAAEPWLWLGA